MDRTYSNPICYCIDLEFITFNSPVRIFLCFMDLFSQNRVVLNVYASCIEYKDFPAVINITFD